MAGPPTILGGRPFVGTWVWAERQSVGASHS